MDGHETAYSLLFHSLIQLSHRVEATPVWAIKYGPAHAAGADNIGFYHQVQVIIGVGTGERQFPLDILNSDLSFSDEEIQNFQPVLLISEDTGQL